MKPAGRSVPLILVIAAAGLLICLFDLADAFFYYCGFLNIRPLSIPQSIGFDVIGRLTYHDGYVSASFGIILNGILFLVGLPIPLANRRFAPYSRS